jgi:hypothetical protein
VAEKVVDLDAERKRRDAEAELNRPWIRQRGPGWEVARDDVLGFVVITVGGLSVCFPEDQCEAIERALKLVRGGASG